MAKDIDDSAFDEDADLFASYDVYKMLVDEGFSRTEALKKAGLSETELRDFEAMEQDEMDIKSQFTEEWDKGGDDEFDEDGFPKGGGEGLDDEDWNEEDDFGFGEDGDDEFGFDEGGTDDDF